MSVSGTGGKGPHAEAFLGSIGSPDIGAKAPHHHTSPYTPHGFANGAGRMLDHGQPPPRPATILRHSRALLLRGGIPTARDQPTRKRTSHEPEVSTPRLGPGGPKPVREYQPVHPIDYACRPRLRTRLTRGRKTWPRNPWSSSARVFHPRLATHVCILTPRRSTDGLTPPLRPIGDALLPSRNKATAASSVACLSPATLSARNH